VVVVVTRPRCAAHTERKAAHRCRRIVEQLILLWRPLAKVVAMLLRGVISCTVATDAATARMATGGQWQLRLHGRKHRSRRSRKIRTRVLC
jgi:hypothetical protein